MSKKYGTGLSPVPINTPQISKLLANSSENEMVFYEYEIVDKDKEEMLGSVLASRYGYCLCRRWLFLLIGNFILISLISAICAILLYVNQPIDINLKPLTFNEVCTTGSANCDSLRNLECKNNVCVCKTNTVWNGTDCSCQNTEFFDGTVW
jgi:hypothetical protein